MKKLLLRTAFLIAATTLILINVQLLFDTSENPFFNQSTLKASPVYGDEYWGDDELLDDSGESANSVCPDGGFKTTGWRRSSVKTMYRVKTKGEMENESSLNLFQKLGDIEISLRYSADVEIVPVMTQAYSCWGWSSKICWSCNRYVVISMQDPA